MRPAKSPPKRTYRESRLFELNAELARQARIGLAERLKRLDEEYEADKRSMERRLARWAERRVDLGDDANV